MEIAPQFLGSRIAFYNASHVPAHLEPLAGSQAGAALELVRNAMMEQLPILRPKYPAFNKDHRNALSGHEPGDTTSDVYEDDLQPRDLVPIVVYLASFIPPIPKRPLNLRPLEFQKFGKPRGRRMKLKRDHYPSFGA